MPHVPSQYEITAAMQRQLGAGGPNSASPNRTPAAEVARMLDRSTEAAGLNPNSGLVAPGTPV